MAYQIFLSSCFDSEMQKSREIFRADLIARFNERSGQYGENTFITDFEYGIPDGLKAKQIIDICMSGVKKADLFLSILGNRYGYCIGTELIEVDLLDFRDLLMPESKGDKQISFFEIEILTALLFIPEKTVFFVWDTSEREERAARLLNALEERGYDINVFGTRDKLVELAVSRFAYYSGYLFIDEIDGDRKQTSSELPGTIYGIAPDNLTVSQMQYLSRKLRYNISQETILSKISAYVDSDSVDTFVLAGASGCGKSMALAEWIRKNMDREDISIHCWFHEEGAGILSVVLLGMLSDLQKDVNYFYQDDAVHAFYNMALENYTVKQVFVLDGMEHLVEAVEAGWLITSMNPTVKIIISLDSDYCQYLPKAHVILEKITALPVQKLIRHIYRKEGKQLEYPFIQNTLEDICGNWSLRQTAEGLQQFLRIMKYQPRSSEENGALTRIRAYLGEFDSIYGIFDKTKLYLENHFDKKVIHQSISLLALTERGLTRNELSDLMQGRTEIFYQLYFVLVQNEDLFMLPGSIAKQQICRLSEEETLSYRKQLIEYFKSSGTDRAMIELCWQLVMMSDVEGLVEFLSSIRNWSLIHTNSSLYFAGLDNILLKEQWERICSNWKKLLLEQGEQFSEKEIFTISDGLNTLCKLEDAADVIEILISRGGDAVSLASYHQQIASLYEDLGDERAIYHIGQAIYFLETIDQNAFVQNKIDTYLTGAFIYAFFLDKEHRSAEQRNQFTDTLEKWLYNAVSLAEQASYQNTTYQILCYHNAAYIYWNTNQYRKALEYIDYALSIPRFDKSLTVSDLTLRAQIYNDMYCEENEYLSEETGLLMVGEDPENQYLIFAGRDLQKAKKLQQKLVYNMGKTSYFDELAELHYIMSQNFSYRGCYREAIEEIDAALEMEKSADVTQDLYATYYQASVVRLGAYNKWKEKRFLTEALDYLKKAEAEIMHYGTVNAYYYLEDVQKQKDYVLEVLGEGYISGTLPCNC